MELDRNNLPCVRMRHPLQGREYIHVTMNNSTLLCGRKYYRDSLDREGNGNRDLRSLIWKPERAVTCPDCRERLRHGFFADGDTA